MLRKTMVRIVITAIVFIALAGTAVFALVSYNGSGSLGDMRSGALNFVIDQSGIKQRIEDQLYDQANEFAETRLVERIRGEIEKAKKPQENENMG